MPEPDASQGTFIARAYEPVRVPALYRAAAIGVLAMVVLQVVLYIGLVAAAAFGVVWWGEHGLMVFEGTGQVGGRAALFLLILRGVAYAGPLIAGGMLVLTMAAPLIPRRAEHHASVSLDRAEHGRTYAYVERLCEVMGAPRPTRIDVTCDPNASAHLEGGVFGVLFGRRPVLTIGLSLAAGMRASELTGVIAHELAHFSQGAGMRSTRVIGRLNDWFAHAVYHRGRMDAAIDGVLEDSWWPLQLLAFVCRVLVGLVRLILLVFMLASHAVSMYLMRRMEFAADACQARVAGSRNAAWSFARLIELSAGWERGFVFSRDLWTQQRKLVNDLPALCVRMSPTGRRRADGFLADYQDKTAWHSTHPATTDRVAAIVRAAEPGILAGDGPARRLFDGFDDLCRITTAHFFLARLGEQYDDRKLISVERALGVGHAGAAPAPGPRDVAEVEEDPNAPIPLA